MVKTTITETTEKYDKDGNLIEKVVREEIAEDDTDYRNVPLYTPQHYTLSEEYNSYCGDYGKANSNLT